MSDPSSCTESKSSTSSMLLTNNNIFRLSSDIYWKIMFYLSPLEWLKSCLCINRSFHQTYRIGVVGEAMKCVKNIMTNQHGGGEERIPHMISYIFDKLMQAGGVVDFGNMLRDIHILKLHQSSITRLLKEQRLCDYVIAVPFGQSSVGPGSRNLHAERIFHTPAHPVIVIKKEELNLRLPPSPENEQVFRIWYPRCMRDHNYPTDTAAGIPTNTGAATTTITTNTEEIYQPYARIRIPGAVETPVICTYDPAVFPTLRTIKDPIISEYLKRTLCVLSFSNHRELSLYDEPFITLHLLPTPNEMQSIIDKQKSVHDATAFTLVEWARLPLPTEPVTKQIECGCNSPDQDDMDANIVHVCCPRDNYCRPDFMLECNVLGEIVLPGFDTCQLASIRRSFHESIPPGTYYHGPTHFATFRTYKTSTRRIPGTSHSRRALFLPDGADIGASNMGMYPANWQSRYVIDSDTSAMSSTIHTKHPCDRILCMWSWERIVELLLQQHPIKPASKTPH